MTLVRATETVRRPGLTRMAGAASCGRTRWPTYTCFIQSTWPIFSNSKYNVTQGHIISG